MDLFWADYGFIDSKFGISCPCAGYGHDIVVTHMSERCVKDGEIVEADVTAFEWRKDPASGSEFTVYIVNIKTDSKNNWVISKRFSEFQKLYRTVQLFLGQFVFPSNFTWGKLSDESLERRRVQLQEFLVTLLSAAEEHEDCRAAVNEFACVPSDSKAAESKTESANADGSYYSYMQKLSGYYSSSTGAPPAPSSAAPAPSPAQPAASDAYFSRMVCKSSCFSEAAHLIHLHRF